jgi:putative endonuclease
VDSKELGRHGEDIAAAHLESCGYRLLARNWRDRAGEIDIVAQRDGSLVFVEVKTRRGVGRGFPAEAVTAAKLERMRRSALAWLAGNRVRHSGLRLDVIAILVDGSAHELTHLQGVGQ